MRLRCVCKTDLRPLWDEDYWDLRNILLDGTSGPLRREDAAFAKLHWPLVGFSVTYKPRNVFVLCMDLSMSLFGSNAMKVFVVCK